MNLNLLIKAIFIILILQQPFELRAQNIKVTLLGTGSPKPSIERFGPSTLVQAGGQNFLFDCGRGAAQRLWQLRIPPGKIDKLFLTHLHSDHTVGIPDVWLTGWIPAPYGKRNKIFKVWGPTGTEAMMHYLERAYAWDITTRKHEHHKSASGIIVRATDIKQGIIYDKYGVKITAFTVDHADFIDSALGYRVDYDGHSVVLSGDTRYNSNLIHFAKGTDLIIHEVAIANENSGKNNPLVRQILGFHSSPEDAGKVFAQVKPKLAVFYHIVQLMHGGPKNPPPGPEGIIQRTRKFYKGPLQVGEDLMTITIGDSIIVKKIYQKGISVKTKNHL